MVLTQFWSPNQPLKHRDIPPGKLKVHELEESHRAVKLHENIQITVVTRLTPDNRTEDADLGNAILFSQFRLMLPDDKLYFGK